MTLQRDVTRRAKILFHDRPV